jgi:hypothetical protein
VFEVADVSGGRVAPAPQTIDFIAGFRAIRGRLFFGFFLLAKQKKETRQRRKIFKISLLQATPPVVTEKTSLPQATTPRCHGTTSLLQATNPVVTEKISLLQATPPVVTEKTSLPQATTPRCHGTTSLLQATNPVVTEKISLLQATILRCHGKKTACCKLNKTPSSRQKPSLRPANQHGYVIKASQFLVN